MRSDVDIVSILNYIKPVQRATIKFLAWLILRMSDLDNCGLAFLSAIVLSGTYFVAFHLKTGFCAGDLRNTGLLRKMCAMCVNCVIASRFLANTVR